MTVLNPVAQDPVSPKTIEGAGPVVALVGAPNAGKTTLFNGLTGGRAKVGNYPGVTVELREGRFKSGGAEATIVDLPGITGLHPRSADARVTVDVLEGRSEAVARPDMLIAVVDAGQIRRQLPFLAALTGLGIPMVVALNMYDLAERDGMRLDPEALSVALGVPVIPTTAPRAQGRKALAAAITAGSARMPQPVSPSAVGGLTRDVILEEPGLNRLTRTLDAVFLHPVFGLVILLGLLFVIFQAVFAWAEAPMGWIETGVAALSGGAEAVLPDNWIQSLLVDGIIAGVGAVVIFLPQIVILFFFILLLEQSGYMARAAFLADELMIRAGLNGRAFIPLLSSFACAIPGMMAARTLDNERDRLTTILVAPLMTCSARLPVYTVLIGALSRRPRSAHSVFRAS